MNFLLIFDSASFQKLMDEPEGGTPLGNNKKMLRDLVIELNLLIRFFHSFIRAESA